LTRRPRCLWRDQLIRLLEKMVGVQDSQN
jgi:hypothetical protein